MLRLAALIATYVIAITAVFVIWPAVGAAPWEVSVEERELRCLHALELWGNARMEHPPDPRAVSLTFENVSRKCEGLGLH